MQGNHPTTSLGLLRKVFYSLLKITPLLCAFKSPQNSLYKFIHIVKNIQIKVYSNLHEGVHVELLSGSYLVPVSLQVVFVF